MNCRNCNAPLLPGSLFCTQCGCKAEAAPAAGGYSPFRRAGDLGGMDSGMGAPAAMGAPKAAPELRFSANLKRSAEAEAPKVAVIAKPRPEPLAEPAPVVEEVAPVVEEPAPIAPEILVEPVVAPEADEEKTIMLAAAPIEEEIPPAPVMPAPVMAEPKPESVAAPEETRCSNCGSVLEEGASFCGVCGNRVAPPAEIPVAAPAEDYAEAAPYSAPGFAAPVEKLKTNKRLWKFLLFGFLTFGIYNIVVLSSVSNCVNTVATRYDGKRTMHYCLLYFLVSWLTLGIADLVWYHKMSNRIGDELDRRGVDYSFGAGRFWIFRILLGFVFIGPFIYYYKLFKACNKMCEHYNYFG